jgi:hypothetical protein
MIPAMPMPHGAAATERGNSGPAPFLTALSQDPVFSPVAATKRVFPAKTGHPSVRAALARRRSEELERAYRRWRRRAQSSAMV